MPSDLGNDVAKSIAADLAPSIAQKVEDHKDAILAMASPAPVRFGLKIGWDGLMREVPLLTEAVVGGVLDKFGPMSISDIAGILVRHQAARGRTCHSSVHDVYEWHSR
jgi:hypothetical protein